MDKLASLWLFVRRRKYLITFVLFVVLVGFWMKTALCVVWGIIVRKRVCAGR